ncbi:MAG TPA: hypothetical protein VJU54_06640, partial [Nitrospiraceae bacterium]|nr:hypothetical protein [Nitrospiraceae bacterium]
MEKCAWHHEKGWRSRLRGLFIGMAACSLVAGAGSEVFGSTLSNDFRLWTPVFLTVGLPQNFIG